MITSERSSLKRKEQSSRAKNMSIQELRNAKSQLANAGWTHILTSMSDTKTDKFGLLFTKGKQEFWFNINTKDQLPTILSH